VPKAGTQEIATLLREYAQRTALRGGNPYRANAYSRAVDSIAALAVPIERLIEEDRLTEIPGVGEAIADIVTKLHRTGTHPSLEKLRQDIPAGVLELSSVPGLRPEKVLRLYKDLGITSLAALEQAAKDDWIKKAKGLGPSAEATLVRTGARQIRYVLSCICVLGTCRARSFGASRAPLRPSTAASYSRFSATLAPTVTSQHATSPRG